MAFSLRRPLFCILLLTGGFIETEAGRVTGDGTTSGDGSAAEATVKKIVLTSKVEGVDYQKLTSNSALQAKFEKAVTGRILHVGSFDSLPGLHVGNFDVLPGDVALELSSGLSGLSAGSVIVKGFVIVKATINWNPRLEAVDFGATFHKDLATRISKVAGEAKTGEEVTAELVLRVVEDGTTGDDKKPATLKTLWKCTGAGVAGRTCAFAGKTLGLCSKTGTCEECIGTDKDWKTTYASCGPARPDGLTRCCAADHTCGKWGSAALCMKPEENMSAKETAVFSQRTVTRFPVDWAAKLKIGYPEGVDTSSTSGPKAAEKLQTQWWCTHDLLGKADSVKKGSIHAWCDDYLRVHALHWCTTQWIEDNKKGPFFSSNHEKRMQRKIEWCEHLLDNAGDEEARHEEAQGQDGPLVHSEFSRITQSAILKSP